MDTVSDICQYCERVDPNSFDPPPPGYFSIYPLYSSKARAEATKAGEEFTANWKRACKVDGLHENGLDFQGCITHLGHYVEWGYPDCLPDRISICAEACDFAYFWDDVTDALSMEQNAEITQDLAIPMLTEMQSGKRIDPKLEINKIGVKIIRDLLDKDHETGLDKVISWKAHLDSQSKSTHNDMSFEQYTRHRFTEVGAMWAVELGCWAHDIHVTKEEKTSVQFLIQVCLTGGMLGNDYYSFNKEFSEHQRTNTLHRIQNSLALLMRDYGYTEDEARDILRKEIQRREREFIDGFEAWSKRAGPESTELRRYLVMVLVMVSGTMFWMAHAGRYHRTDITATAEDRATIVGKSNGPLRVLDGYSPPKALGRVSSSLECPTTTTMANNKRRPAGMPNESSTGNGDSNGAMAEEDHHHSTAFYTAPFQRAPSNICEAPYEYINSLQSKNMRNKLIDALNVWLRVPPGSLQVIKNIVQLLHNSSLMLDDIEDVSSLRRGQPATHIFYGTSQTINSANFTYVKTVQETTRLHNPNCIDIFIDELTSLHCGQSLELHWRHHARCPTTDEYIMMVDNKTGGLFRLMLRLLEAESPISLPSCTSLARLFTLTGRYYQIRDDYLNLTSTDYTSQKGFCEDLDEGKFSLPLIHLLNHTPFPDRITSAIYNRGGATKLKREVKSHILEAMEAARTFEYTRGVLGHLHEELMKMLDEVEAKLGPNNGARVLLLGLGLG